MSSLDCCSSDDIGFVYSECPVMLQVGLVLMLPMV